MYSPDPTIEFNYTLNLTNSHFSTSGTSSPKGFIKEKNISDLIKKLEKSGVKIDRKNSQQEINGSEIPLLSKQFKELKDKTTAYILRGNNLEIKIRDYSETESHNPLGVIGGSVRHTYGIKIPITFKGTYNQGKILGTLNNILQDFYTEDLYKEKKGKYFNGAPHKMGKEAEKFRSALSKASRTKHPLSS
jgi:hypothetical protein